MKRHEEVGIKTKHNKHVTLVVNDVDYKIPTRATAELTVTQFIQTIQTDNRIGWADWNATVISYNNENVECIVGFKHVYGYICIIKAEEALIMFLNGCTYFMIKYFIIIMYVPMEYTTNFSVNRLK